MGWFHRCGRGVPAQNRAGVEQRDPYIDAGLGGGVPGVPGVPGKNTYSREDENAKISPREYLKKIFLARENPLEHLEHLEHGGESLYCKEFRCSMAMAKKVEHRRNSYQLRGST